MAESAWQKFAAVGLPWRDPPQQPPERQYFYSDGDKVQSLHSRFRVNLVLTNRTRHNVEVYWVDFDGRESFYGTMEPWSTILVYTFLTHPFVFRSKAHAIGDLLVNNLPVCWPSSSHPFQEVTEAQFCAWTPASHASYFRPKFPQFAAAVRQLLLACNAQHKRPGSRRSSAGGGGGEENLGGCKSRRSSSTGSESGVGEAGCCGQLWKKPGEGTAGTPGVSAVEPQGQASLGLLPYDLVLKIISYLAPPLHFVLPVGKEAVEMLPPPVEHSAQPPVVLMAARLLGPRAPKQPTADAAAWVAAATIVQRAGGGPPGMQLLPAALPAWPLANGVAVDRAAQLLAGAAQQAQHAVIAQAVTAAAEPEAPLPDGTHEVLQFTEALALAHLAFTRVTQMACQQEAQAPVLWQYVKAAREAAGKRGAQDRLAALQQHSTVAMTSQEWQRRLAPWPLEDSMFTPVVAPR